MNPKTLILLASVLVFSLAASTARASFVQQGAKLVGNDAAGAAFQGYWVALSADGSTCVVGGPADNGGAGAAWVYTRSAGVWSQQGPKLVGTGGAGQPLQGTAVAVSADGNTVLVGGYGDNGNMGAVWAWTRSAGVWSQQGPKLVGTGAVSTPVYQGSSLALSADGNTAIVGAPADNDGVGATWIWTRTAGVWSQQGTKLVANDGAGPAQRQGTSVALSADGNTAIAGGNADNNYAGAAWVWTRSAGVWTQQGAKLVGTGAVGTDSNQGGSIAISGDGNTAILGAPGDDGIGGGVGVGAAWVFTRTAGVWTQQGAKLVGTGAVGLAQQGQSVGLSSDGNTAIEYGRYDNAHAGAGWVFTRNAGVWSQQGSKLVGTGAAGIAEMGYTGTLSADGNTTVAGGVYDNGTAGAVWMFAQVPSISGAVLTQCPAAAPAPGVVVSLLQEGTPFASTVTLSDGSYAFNNVPPGTYIVAVTAPAGFGTPVDTRLVTLDAGGTTQLLEPFVFTCLLGDVSGSVLGSCGGRGDCNDDGKCDLHDSESASCHGHGDCDHDGDVDDDDGTCEMASSGLLGVTVDLFSIDSQGHEALVAVSATGPGGAYRFSGVAMGDYHVSIVKPLGYTAATGSQIVHLMTPGGAVSAGFALTCMNIESEPRTGEYWKHQVNVYLTCKGRAQESLTQMLGYIDLLFQHFNQNLVNPVIVYVPNSNNTQDKLRQLEQLLTVNRSGTALDRAKQQLLALLLNVVSNKISQLQVISNDGATVSQAITYAYDLIIDANASNDGTVATFCERINDGDHVPNGIVPVATRTITYNRQPAGGEASTLRFEGIHPSPARGAFTLVFSLQGLGPASLDVVDVSGRRVLRQDLGGLGAGRHSLGSAEWAPLEPGVYVVRLSEAGRSVSRALTVVR